MLWSTIFVQAGILLSSWTIGKLIALASDADLAIVLRSIYWPIKGEQKLTLRKAVALMMER